MMGRVWKFGDGVDTDVMAPGRYMKLPIAELATHCLETVRPNFASAVRAGDVVVAGKNFGVGSSREQAPQALRELGIVAVIAVSFGGIFYRNALNLGLTTLRCAETASIPDGVGIEVDPARGEIVWDGGRLDCERMPQFLLDMVRDGGLLPHLKRTLSAANAPAAP
jgi:3-isopropylmalate/(R)-2-methylmalate dehydratase small subunit